MHVQSGDSFAESNGCRFWDAGIRFSKFGGKAKVWDKKTLDARATQAQLLAKLTRAVKKVRTLQACRFKTEASSGRLAMKSSWPYGLDGTD